MKSPERPEHAIGIGQISITAGFFILGTTTALLHDSVLKPALGETTSFILDLIPWLILGILFRKMTWGVLSKTKRLKDTDLINGAIFAIVLLVIIRFFPAAWSYIKSSDPKIQLEMRSAPNVLWDGVIFLMSYHGNVVLNFLKVVKNQIKKGIGLEDEDMQGNAKHRLSMILQSLFSLFRRGEETGN